VYLYYVLYMKFQVTEQFLWTIYSYGEELKSINDIFKIKTFQEITVDQSFWESLKRKRRKGQFSQFINYLKKRGYIKIKENKAILLTPKGKEKSLSFECKIVKNKEFKKRKDNKWIMAVFDIPEKLRRQRDYFRRYLIALGFKKFQKSIWVCPYDNLERLKEIINKHLLDKFIKIFIIEEIDLK